MKLTPILIGTILATLTFTASVAQKAAYSWDNLPQVSVPKFNADTFNIVKYGAKADGVSLNTESINKAITACNAAGGGVVLIPAGLWATGPIVLKSNVNLHINRSALLQFTADKSQYHLVEGNFEGRKSVRNESPISGSNLNNIAITGDGTIDGHGEAWRAMGKDRVTEATWKLLVAGGGTLNDDGKTWYPSDSYARGAKNPTATQLTESKQVGDYQSVKDFFRPNMLVINNCKNVLLQGVTFQNSPAWCLHTLLCENLTFDGVRIRNEPNAQNGDGIDIESCSYVKVENCTLDCGDDGICIKSGKDEEGRKRAKASQYIVVKNNVVYKAHGGFVIGSEMSGGAHDIFVTDCTFIGTDVGLRFKTARGRGGIVENIFIRNINMRGIVHDAIFFDMYYFTKSPTLAQTNGKVAIPLVNEGTPQFRKFYINNLGCDGAERAMMIRGLPEMSIKDIYLTDLMIKAQKGPEIIEASNINLVKVILQCEQSQPLINVENSQNLTFKKMTSKTSTEVFFSINGERTKQIMVDQASFSGAKSKASFNYGADKSVLTIEK